ncbi:helix-turn-helix domain-containing protein [Lactococcus allomyrinae]|nr:helix-turn-helix domain-containing protein [Lactococcus allomyrinae]
MMGKISQSDRILQFIKEKGSITRLQAANEVGAFELSARIVELEREGYTFIKEPIKVKNRYGDTVRVMQYSLFGE